MRNNDHKYIGSKGNPYDHYTEEEKKKLEAMLKKMVTSDNSDYQVQAKRLHPNPTSRTSDNH
jgi:hypothetical protein